MMGLGLVNKQTNTITKLGRIIYQLDPYFEKDETLLILHYVVSCNPEWIIWHRLVNTVIPMQDKFVVEKSNLDQILIFFNREDRSVN